MKSVIQEGSSLVKAIEEGWKKAGKPTEFSVKIYQEAEYGFLGLGTKKNAKVCIFFEEMPLERHDKQKRDFKKNYQKPHQQIHQPRDLQEKQITDDKSTKPDFKKRDNHNNKNRPNRRNFTKRDNRPFEKKSTDSVVVNAEPQQKKERVEVKQQNSVEKEAPKKVINAFVSRDK